MLLITLQKNSTISKTVDFSPVSNFEIFSNKMVDFFFKFDFLYF